MTKVRINSIYKSKEISRVIKNILYNENGLLSKILNHKKNNKDKYIELIDKNMDKFLLPLSVLYDSQFIEKNHETKTYYSRLNNKILNAPLGSDLTSAIISFLIDYKFIKTDGVLIWGVKSYGYRFHKDWESKIKSGEVSFTKEPTELEVDEKNKYLFE